MKNDVEQHLEIYEESKRYRGTGITVITKDYADNTAITTTDMSATEFVNTLIVSLSDSLIKIGNVGVNEKQFVQDVVMQLLHDKGLPFSEEFMDALPKHKDFPILSPSTAIVEATSDILARLSE